MQDWAVIRALKFNFRYRNPSPREHSWIWPYFPADLAPTHLSGGPNCRQADQPESLGGHRCCRASSPPTVLQKKLRIFWLVAVSRLLPACTDVVRAANSGADFQSRLPIGTHFYLFRHPLLCERRRFQAVANRADLCHRFARTDRALEWMNFRVCFSKSSQLSAEYTWEESFRQWRKKVDAALRRVQNYSLAVALRTRGRTVNANEQRLPAYGIPGASRKDGGEGEGEEGQGERQAKWRIRGDGPVAVTPEVNMSLLAKHGINSTQNSPLERGKGAKRHRGHIYPQ